MDKYLIDDHLEEKRRHQRKELEEERGEQHFAQEMAIFVDRAQEPGDVESSCEIRKRGPLRHQHQPAVPCRFELGSRH